MGYSHQPKSTTAQKVLAIFVLLGLGLFITLMGTAAVAVILIALNQNA